MSLSFSFETILWPQILKQVKKKFSLTHTKQPKLDFNTCISKSPQEGSVLCRGRFFPGMPDIPPFDWTVHGFRGGNQEPL